METDEDISRGNMLDDMPPISCDVSLEGDVGTGSNDIGDMTFCMGNYISDFMKVSLLYFQSLSANTSYSKQAPLYIVLCAVRLPQLQ